jgi:hypothetical protein
VHKHDVAGQPGIGSPGKGQARGRPDEPLCLPRDHLDDRPVDLEVVKVIGVDLGDRGGLPCDAQVVDDTARGLRRVIPPLERGDRYRVDERAIDVAELDDFTSA